jgi:hypothetical protein
MVDPCPPPDAGVVSDDLEEIVHALSDEDLDLQLWHALDHLAGVIRLLAYLELPAG